MVLPHARALLDRTTPDTDTARTGLLLNHLGLYLTGQGDQTRGDLGRAIPLYEATLADSEQVLGPDHPTTKVIRSNHHRGASVQSIRNRPTLAHNVLSSA